jgi:5,10-methylenetetrahydromethanopterin reductase
MRVTVSDFPAKGNALTAGQIVELAQVAEASGAARFGVTDFPFHQECVALMAACLARTETLEVESLVTTPFRRAADVTACAWATLAELSGGRAILGLGRGGGQADTYVPPWGWRRPDALAAMAEFVAICRAMWSGETPREEGAILHTSGRSLEFLPGVKVPILIAARGPRMLELAGECADIVHIALPFLGFDHMRNNVAKVREAATAVGRDPDSLEIDMTIGVSVSRDRAFAMDAARLTTAVGILWTAGAERDGQADDHTPPSEFDVPRGLVADIANDWNMWTGEPLPSDISARIDEELIARFVVAGTPKECGDRMLEVAAELPGVTGIRVKLPPLTGKESFDQFREMIELVGAMSPALATV